MGRRGRKASLGASGEAGRRTSGVSRSAKSASRDLPETVSFHRLAEAEFLEAASFYEERLAGLGLGFIEEVERSLRSIASHPLAAPILRGAVRRRVIHRFPFSVLYWINGERIRIVAVMNHRRHPDSWSNRR